MTPAALFRLLPAVFLSLLLSLGASPGIRAQQVAPQRFPSPHGAWVVEVFQRDPGGVGSPQTIVTLHKSRQRVSTFQDNILVVDGAHIVSVKWSPGAKQVTVFCPGCDVGSAETAVTQLNDIVITFVTDPVTSTPPGTPATPPPGAEESYLRWPKR